LHIRYENVTEMRTCSGGNPPKNPLIKKIVLTPKFYLPKLWKKQNMTASDGEQKRREYMKEYRQKNKNVTKRVSVTLTNKEYLKLKKSAEEFGISPTKRLKSLAFEHLNNQNKYPFEVQKSLKELVHILRGVGNNINQIARYSNTVKRVWDEEKALKHLMFLEEQIQAFLNKKNK